MLHVEGAAGFVFEELESGFIDDVTPLLELACGRAAVVVEPDGLVVDGSDLLNGFKFGSFQPSSARIDRAGTPRMETSSASTMDLSFTVKLLPSVPPSGGL